MHQRMPSLCVCVCVCVVCIPPPPPPPPQITQVGKGMKEGEENLLTYEYGSVAPLAFFFFARINVEIVDGYGDWDYG
ncbi:hypothetical protein IWX47DRAFT_877431, partial [Phyllosticta citricarpa]